MSGFLIQFLTRQGCHLCDAARSDVEWAARKAKTTVEVVDVESNDQLIADFGLRIPVVLVGEHVVAEGVINRNELLKNLKRLR